MTGVAEFFGSEEPSDAEMFNALRTMTATPEVLALCLRHPNADVRWAAVLNDGLNEAQWRQAARDPEQLVRFAGAAVAAQSSGNALFEQGWAACRARREVFRNDPDIAVRARAVCLCAMKNETLTDEDLLCHAEIANSRDDQADRLAILWQRRVSYQEDNPFARRGYWHLLDCVGTSLVNLLLDEDCQDADSERAVDMLYGILEETRVVKIPRVGIYVTRSEQDDVLAPLRAARGGDATFTKLFQHF